MNDEVCLSSPVPCSGVSGQHFSLIHFEYKPFRVRTSKRFSNVCFKDLGGDEGLGPILNLTLAGKRRAEKCRYIGLAIYSPLVAARINSVLSPGLLFQ